MKPIPTDKKPKTMYNSRSDFFIGTPVDTDNHSVDYHDGIRNPLYLGSDPVTVVTGSDPGCRLRFGSSLF